MASNSDNPDNTAKESKGTVNEEKVAVFDDNDQNMVRWLLKRSNLSPLLRGQVPAYEDLTAGQKQIFGEFLKVPECRRLLLSCETGELVIHDSKSPPYQSPAAFAYFVRPPTPLPTPETITSLCRFGQCGGQTLELVFQIMSSLYVPSTIQTKKWPEVIKKEFTRSVHRFMASLTEGVNQAKGKTILYVPKEPIGPLSTAIKDKDLLQLLESTVIHWTRQIKEVVNNQDSVHNTATAGPLEEIAFWRFRTIDLSGITEQLGAPEVVTILKFLAAAKSSYLEPFNKLSTLIQHGCEEANDNLKFLSVLTGTCEELAKAEPKNIPSLLPKLLQYIRMIWSVSKFYTTEERLTGLLRKVSNEIIQRCCDVISLEDIFDGDVASSILRLRESIDCGVQWKRMYQTTKAAIRKNNPEKSKQWSFDDANIFAQIDAFVQRCRDLLEVCEGQMQFAQRSLAAKNGNQSSLPVFGGQRGPEVIQNLIDIEKTFEHHLQNLKALNYDILDVKATRWHDDFNQFKSGVKDLEVMMQNLINAAFDTVQSVTQGVKILDAFHGLAKREAIIRCVEKKTVVLYELFKRQLDLIKGDFEARRKNPPVLTNEPKFSGSGQWALGLMEWIKIQYEAIEQAEFLTPSADAKAMKSNYTDLKKTLEEYINRQYQDWLESMSTPEGTQLHQLLETPLLKYEGGSKSHSGKIQSNFDQKLLRVFTEVKHWEKYDMPFVIPYVAHDISNQQDKLQRVRQHVLEVVREYNSILDSLTTTERKLFQEHIRRLDRRISPGFSKLNWASKDISEWFVKDSRGRCQELMKIVKEFHEKKNTISGLVRKIGSTLLIGIQKNRVYEASEFQTEQEATRQSSAEVIRGAYAEINEHLDSVYRHFEHDSKSVQAQWSAYIRSINKEVEAALRMSVRKSMMEFARAINGDRRAEPQAFLKVFLVLEGKDTSFDPKLPELSELVQDVGRHMLDSIKGIGLMNVKFVTKNVQRKVGVGVPLNLAGNAPPPKEKPKPPEQPREQFYDLINGDSDIQKHQWAVVQGINRGAKLAQDYTAMWLRHRKLYENSKEDYIVDYEKNTITPSEEPLLQFETDVDRFKTKQEEIQLERVSSTIDFIEIDCSRLRASLVRHCIEWQKLHTDLLNRLVRNQLEGLHQMIKDNTTTLSERPNNIGRLNELLTLLQALKKKLPDTEAQFEPIENQYALLHKFEVRITDNEQQLLNTLQSVWAAFLQTLKKAERSLNISSNSMEKDFRDALKDFAAACIKLREDSQNALPYSDDFTIEKACAINATFTERLKEKHEAALVLKDGLPIFHMTMPDDKPLTELEADLNLLDRVWGLAKSWDEKWQGWKVGKFKDLDVAVLERAGAIINKQVSKLGRQIKTWESWQQLKKTVDEFRATLPLILNLRNPAMRPRHWTQLREELGDRKQFDPYSDSFTMETVFSLGLSHNAEYIAELSTVANKELAIEEALENIGKSWATIDIDIAPFKEIYFKVRSTEDLFSQLEDNSVALSTMKASRFYNTFKKDINHWEATLSNLSEVVDLTLTVQRQWMYLESIFMGSEDIREQLRAESILFDKVNKNWVKLMNSYNANPNALAASGQDGVLDLLNSTNEDLERIQKSLDQYLETKRQMFPRFYFLSNADLLEILGQQKDPEQVQKHIKKCFEGIKRLDMIKPGARGNKTVEAQAMTSPDGEVVPFHTNVIVAGAVEKWLISVEDLMIEAIQKQLKLCMTHYPKSNKAQQEKWVRDWPGQMLIIVGKIKWTWKNNRALELVAKGNRSALKRVKRKQIKYLTELADFVRTKLNRVERKKTVALITMEIHSRDVMERMLKANAKSTDDFIWNSQQRFRFYPDEGADVNNFGRCRVFQTNTEMEFGYEYQGNNGRLVVTQLTDRCVLTLTTALHLQRGGNPLGPAGTGKTETVKDLGKNLAKYVVVFNCSDGLDYKSVGRMFSGLCQSGGWGCFDEFNRIEIEVLSVIASQILSIMTAISEKKHKFLFEGIMIRCRWSCGIFVTMNPGYAGRTPLPDNLRSLMRPVAMMTPDLGQIAEVMLMAEGFRDARVLGKKAVNLYALMVQQLSKQPHYDYGLRSLKAVLGSAGALKRNEPDMSEDMIVLRALRDMNVPKFIKADFKLFLLLLGDLFPGLDLPNPDYGVLLEAINTEIKRAGLQPKQFTINKTIQLYDSQALRHCNMLVGLTQGGKSTAWKLLQKAKTALAKEHKLKDYTPVRVHVLNPKSITMKELYGAYDLATMEWTDGTLSVIFRNCAQDEKSDEKWILLDGPVDTLWIESMNTVMDDNKALTLINGERINMSNEMALVFEVENLDVASPATVSRAGMVYLDAEDLGWQPYVQSWMERQFGDNKELLEFYAGLFEKFVEPMLKARKLVKTLIPISETASVVALCKLYQIHANSAAAFGKPPHKPDDKYYAMAEKIFAYCIVWSLGGGATGAGRIKLDTILRDIEPFFPPTNLVYDFYFDNKTKDFRAWDDRVSKAWKPPRDAQFFQIVVPTIDTERNEFNVTAMILAGIPTLVIGQTGTGKTMIVKKVLSDLPESHQALNLFFSAATTAGLTQDIIEGSMEKRAKGKLGPTGGKRLVTFIDDLNMPTQDLFGSQGALELMRQWIDYSGWYDRKRNAWNLILDMNIVAAMGPPGGGRSAISTRTQSRFAVINFPFPTDPQLERIFNVLYSNHLSSFNDECQGLASPLTKATCVMYKEVAKNFLPTPKKCHYLFNLRDISKVTQGVLQSSSEYFDVPEKVVRLWAHEAMCVFSDRFTTLDDQSKFRGYVNNILSEHFSTNWSNLMGDCKDEDAGPIFVDFMESEEKSIYNEVAGSDYGKLKMRLEETLEDYNLEPGLVPMDLVLFETAARIICKITRVLQQRRGNFMIVGVGGTGRQSLTRLAAFQCNYSLITINITKRYGIEEFHEDLRRILKQAGADNKGTVFLFNDTQLKEEAFLEDINNILASGQVPNLLQEEDRTEILDKCRAEAKKEGLVMESEIMDFFTRRVRKNLHVVLAMSPVGDPFRFRCRQYPSLVSCTTILWFHGWPADALQEVAINFLEETDLGTSKMKDNVGKSFAAIHLSVSAATQRMLLELKRYNYVTPTHYLELVKGYSEILDKKRGEMQGQLKKLSDGVSKLDESREQVEEMSIKLEKKQEVVAQATQDCEALLVNIVSEQRTADEQRKQVEADEQRIGAEELECKSIAHDAEKDLAVALPALEKAMAAVDKLDKSSISEVKAYNSPPALVQLCLEAVMILFKTKTDWATAKKKLSESNFLIQIKGYNKDKVSASQLKKLKKYINNANFQVEKILRVSTAAGALCQWVHAINIYARVSEEVAPKRLKLKEAMQALQIKQASLKEAQDKLAKVQAQLKKLSDQYEKSVSEKNALKDEAEQLQLKLERASNLVAGLGGEKTRWNESTSTIKVGIANTVGDALLASASRSYAGPFDTLYRANLMLKWRQTVSGGNIPFTKDLTFSGFLAKPVDVRDWKRNFLPVDDFSTENGVIVTQCARWPLMIDPQKQANKWIKSMEGKQLKVVDFKMPDFVRQLENAIAFGSPYLLEDIEVELDPAIAPVLNKEIVKMGTREIVRLGDKELDWSKDFRMYLTTKLSNPHYPPEVSTKTTIVNFAVKQEGLEAQLLGCVVRAEEEELEIQKDKLVTEVAEGKRKLVDLEDLILKMLSETQGSLLDDAELVNTLNRSKVTADAVRKKMVVAEETEIRINEARNSYMPIATRATILYFILYDFSLADPMYQFALEAYVVLFINSIEVSRSKAGNETIVQRIEGINKYHTLEVYKQTCLGLFEKHKLLLSFQICTKILQHEKKINDDEFQYFLRGGIVFDRGEQRDKPHEWLTPTVWDNITELDKIEAFKGIASSVEQLDRDWAHWYLQAAPDATPLPADWQSKLDEFQRMCVVRAFRLDRVVFAAKRFVGSNMGQAFIEPPPFDLMAIFKTSQPPQPLVFVLSPGVDPTSQVFGLGNKLGIPAGTIALGQGQGPIAMNLIEDGIENGKFVFLANCHLMVKWLPKLEKKIAAFAGRKIHKNFRLWLSSNPTPKFPIAILQGGVKMTTEPPRGLRANLLRLYNRMTEDKLDRSSQPHKFKPLLFGLCWFHSILLERRKFKALGFAVPYDFNDSDYDICEDILALYIETYVDFTPWEAIRYLTANANYGGRVTDSWDRRLVNVYINEFYSECVIDTPKHRLSELSEYYVPPNGNLDSYKTYIQQLPVTDKVQAFGQHDNADISSQWDDTNILLRTIISLQPRAVSTEGASSEDKVLSTTNDLIEKAPPIFNMAEIRAILESRSDPGPLKSVLKQELERYNSLLVLLHSSLKDLNLGIQGLVVITPALESVFDSLLVGVVPDIWGFCYPSLKPLASWMSDLQQRCVQMKSWSYESIPRSLWMSGLTYPTGILTAILQTTARQNGIAIDTLSWDFPVFSHGDVSQVTKAPDVGMYVHGLFLEGAKWDTENGCLADAMPMELTSPMPIIHFKPIDTRRRLKGTYSCPLYLYPVRTGTRERPSFMTALDLKSGSVDSTFWVKRGTALLLSLSY